jgi:PAS domain-containing protein
VFRELDENNRFRIEAFTHRKDGAPVYVEGITIALREEKEASGHITGYVNIRRDITERKRAEEKPRRSEAYLAVAEKLSHTGSWAWNVSTGALFWSLERPRLPGPA